MRGRHESVLAFSAEELGSFLRSAVERGETERLGVILSIMAEAGLSGRIDLPDTSGTTPLLEASARGHLGCVELLLAAGADPCRRDMHGRDASDFGFAVRDPRPGQFDRGHSLVRAFSSRQDLPVRYRVGAADPPALGDEEQRELASELAEAVREATFGLEFKWYSEGPPRLWLTSGEARRLTEALPRLGRGRMRYRLVREEGSGGES